MPERPGMVPIDEGKVRDWLRNLEQNGLPKQKVKVVARKENAAMYHFREKMESTETFTEKVIKESPLWLFSIIFHLFLLILLALILATDTSDSTSIINVTFSESEGEQLDRISPVGPLDEIPVSERINTNLPISVPAAQILDPITDIGPSTAFNVSPSIGMNHLLNGRMTESSRNSLLKKYGGTKTTEESVQNGLKWLVKNQITDDSGTYWSLTGPYSGGGHFENRAAATAMALIAFQGNGHTHKSRTQYSKLVEKAWIWMLKQQDGDGAFGTKERLPYGHRFYTHALAAIALSELYGMTGDKKFREPAARAVRYLVENQSQEGGWRYTPKDDADLSVTGWCIIALKSAQMSKIDVPSQTLENVSRFLDTVSLNGGSEYSYTAGSSARASMTASGLLAREFLGWDYKHPKLMEGAEWLVRDENLVGYKEGQRNSYYWYYAAQVTHHLGGKYWAKWNGKMRQEVPAAQIRDTKDPEFGSWSPDKPVQEDPSNMWSTGGRLYITCLSIYMLEVYYRHLPVYREAVVR
jgi:hypothetical protein